jgi:FKBP-type peptidyl-prolyl cis-trans isomerase
MRKISLVLFLGVGVTVLGCGGADKPSDRAQGRSERSGGIAQKQIEQAAPVEPGKATLTASGMSIQDLVVGTGAVAEPGKTVSVHYTGWLMDGSKFDSSVDRGYPYAFMLGAGQVPKGWDEGIAGMKVGGKRILIIPPELGFGERGAAKIIPPDATLKYEVELLGVK